jgi:hypothetical protein
MSNDQKFYLAAMTVGADMFSALMGNGMTEAQAKVEMMKPEAIELIAARVSEITL